MARRNSDVTLRELERRALATLAPGDVAAWLSGLRKAGRFQVSSEFEGRLDEAFSRAVTGDLRAAQWLVLAGALGSDNPCGMPELADEDDPDPQSYVWRALWIEHDAFAEPVEITREAVGAAKAALRRVANAALALDYNAAVRLAPEVERELERGEAEYEMRRMNGDYWGRQGAGLLLFSGDKVLLTLRSSEVNEPGTWGIPGGAVHGDEPPYDGALREAQEEFGPLPPHVLFGKVVFQDGEFRYTTFFARVKPRDAWSWSPRLNWENDEARWFSTDELPEDLHFGVEHVLRERPDLFHGRTMRNPRRVARYEAQPGGFWLEVEYEAYGTVTDARRVWFAVGRTYVFDPLSGRIRAPVKKLGRRGVLVDIDQAIVDTGAGQPLFVGRMLFFDTMRESNVWLPDFRESGFDPRASAALARVRSSGRGSLSRSRAQSRSYDAIRESKIERTIEAEKDAAKPMRSRRPPKPPCPLCLKRTPGRGFKICFQCWESSGRPSRSQALELIRAAWRARRGEPAAPAAPPALPPTPRPFSPEPTRPRFIDPDSQE